jgi:excisionase family DNA binding protein
MEQLALTIDQAAKAGGPRRAKLYDEIKKGRLRAIKIGRSTRILVDDFQKYLKSLPAIPPASDPRAASQPRAHGQRRSRRGGQS